MGLGAVFECMYIREGSIKNVRLTFIKIIDITAMTLVLKGLSRFFKID